MTASRTKHDGPAFTLDDAAVATAAFSALPPRTQRASLALSRTDVVSHVTRARGRFFMARLGGARVRHIHGHLGGDIVCSCSEIAACEHVGALLLHVSAAGAAPDAREEEEPLPDAAQRWMAQLARGPGPDAVGGRTQLAFLLSTAGGPRLTLARQTRASTMAKWGPPKPLLGAEARDVIRRESGDVVVDEVVARAIWRAPPSAPLDGRRGAAAFEAALDSGRLWCSETIPPRELHRGDPIDVRLVWESQSGCHYPAVDIGGEHRRLVRLVPSFVADLRSGEVHAADAGGDAARVDAWLGGPALTSAQLHRAAVALPSGFPRPPVLERVEIRAPLRAVLRLFEIQTPVRAERRGDLSLTYDGVPVHPWSRVDPVHVRESMRERTLFRDLAGESDVLDALASEGFVEDFHAHDADDPRTLSFGLADEPAWIELLLDGARRLAARGVHVELDPSFKLDVVESDDWYAELEQQNDWYGVEFGVDVKGVRVSLLPLLVKAFELPANHTAATILITLPDGRRVRVPRARIEPLVDLIMELAASGKDGPARVSKLHAADLARALRLENATLDALRSLRDTLANASSIKLVTPPRKLKAKLRDYQRVGLSWLALLASHGLGGILADDMGLGKTLQVIALLCLAAQARAERGPALVVAPRSVLISWTDQLVAFAPHLAIRIWHAPDRRTWGVDFARFDVVVTTYQLLHKDIDTLAKQRWSVVVLDEAQAIKNAKSVFAVSAMKLEARARFALTGTPLENHLGELWSIAQFVAPGALGDERTFRAAFRNPIEKQHDAERLAALRRRLAPVLLRRTKEQVATELPPKTIIAHRVSLGEKQRDLYEAIRQMASKRVREEIARRGIAQAKIIVLDALLKLRQVCCDPRLLKSRIAKAAVASAKLEAFEELVTTLVDEGRRILVFSQFVEMLDLLDPVLAAHRITRARITGATRDREGEVRRFQAGEVPVFLISLKAGGTGLNLTAADTVIHYDPWWNPAVEAQATDRAHRIGQDKPVFVHRLLTMGTIEEKISELQEKKGALARDVLDGGGSSFQLDESTIAELLAPLRGG